MEIEVHDIVRSRINFNALEFEAIFRHITEEFIRELNYDSFIYYAVKVVSAAFVQDALWSDETSLKLINKSIANSGLFGIIEDKEASPDMMMSPDAIVEGKQYNFPPSTEVGVARFYNAKLRLDYSVFRKLETKFPNLKPMELYPKIAKYYQIEPMTHGAFVLDRVDNPLPLVAPPVRPEPSMNYYGAQISESICERINEVIRGVYYDEAEPNDPYALFAKVFAIGMGAVVGPIIQQDTTMIAEIVDNKLVEINIEALRRAADRRFLDESSAVNQMVRVATANMSNAASIIEVISKNNVTSLAQLTKLIPKKDSDQLRKLIEAEENVNEVRHCAIHTDLIAKIRRPFADVLSLFPLVEDITEYDTETMQYVCTACHRRVLCRHTVEAAKSKNREAALRKFAGDMNGKYVYCKFCNENILDNSMKEDISNVDFEFIQKARALAMENEDTARMSPLVFGAVASIVRNFHSSKKILEERLIRSVNDAIYPFVADAISGKQIPADRFDSMVSVYSMIYASLYMLELYTPDSGLKLEKTSKYLTQNEYAVYFLNLVNSRYSKSIGMQELKLAFQVANRKLKGEYRAAIQYEDVSAKFLAILNSSIYRYLYDRWRIADIRISDRAKVSGGAKNVQKEREFAVSTAIGSIPRVTGMTLSEVDGVNFREKMIKPPAMTKSELDVYTNTADFTSEFCHVHRRTPGCGPTAYSGSRVTNFNPDLANKMKANEAAVFTALTELRDVPVMPVESWHGYCTQYPVEYAYDVDGSLLEWKPERVGVPKPLGRRSTSGTFEDKRIGYNDFVATIAGKRVAISKMNTASLKDRQALVDARNKVLKFKPTPKKKLAIPAVKHAKEKAKKTFKFDEKKLMIVTKLAKKNNPIFAKYLGRTEKASEREVKSASFKPTPINGADSVPIMLMNYYISGLISVYNRLRFNPTSEASLKLINATSKDFLTFQESVSGFASLPPYDITAVKDEYEAESVYAWQQSYYFDALQFLYDLPYIGHQLAAQVYNTAIEEEQMRYGKKTYIENIENGDEYDQPDPVEPEDENTADAEYEEIGNSNKY